MKSILKALALKQNKHRQVIAEKDALFACDHHCIIRYRASFSDAQVPHDALSSMLQGLTTRTTLTSYYT